MVLEYRTNSCTWNMIDSPKIASCSFDVEEDVKKIAERTGDDFGNFHHELMKLMKEKYMIHAGYSPSFETELHIENKEVLSDTKEIVMIAVDKKRGTEIHFFDSEFPYYICCNDGSIFEKSKHFIC